LDLFYTGHSISSWYYLVGDSEKLFHNKCMNNIVLFNNMLYSDEDTITGITIKVTIL
jgi:hypothetical protein